ncbi:hypothetical protein ACFY3U_15035 [Micromonospora sp. NPDC000089]|uniref:hypothetical protein n=1 Tax=unclassified Micromonospora TaxID=2617518 RepID=UPI00367A6930
MSEQFPPGSAEPHRGDPTGPGSSTPSPDPTAAPAAPGWPAQPAWPSQSAWPSSPGAGPAHPGEPVPGQPVPGQPVPGQPTAGQPAAGTPAPGLPGQPAPGHPGQPATGWPVPSQPMPGQPWPAPAPGWGYPPAGGFPPGAGPYPGQQPYGGSVPGGHDPADPLVNPPYAGVNGWFARCLGAARRGWRILLPVLLLTQTVPAAVVSLLSLGLTPNPESVAPDGSLPPGYLSDIAVYGGAVLVATFLLGFVQSVGWAAGTWVVARQAAGEPVDLGGALRYGGRRALGLWGWTLLITVIITAGVCFCVLPGVYLTFALALGGPVYLFERSNPIGRSFRMFHDRLGLVLGRVALVGAALVLGSVLGGVVESVGLLPFGADPLASPGTAVGAVLVIVACAVLVVPAYLAQLVGLVVTYAEQRAHEGPVNAARLLAELG